jgi:hypothetical protein
VASDEFSIFLDLANDRSSLRLRVDPFQPVED